jgi:hypothetical protein
VINYELKKEYYIAVMVRDNGTPPLESYFDVRIAIKDVNEPITSISIKPPAVAESVPPGMSSMEGKHGQRGVEARGEEENKTLSPRLKSYPNTTVSSQFVIQAITYLA